MLGLASRPMPSSVRAGLQCRVLYAGRVRLAVKTARSSTSSSVRTTPPPSRRNQSNRKKSLAGNQRPKRKQTATPEPKVEESKPSKSRNRKPAARSRTWLRRSSIRKSGASNYEDFKSRCSVAIESSKIGRLGDEGHKKVLAEVQGRERSRDRASDLPQAHRGLGRQDAQRRANE